MTAALTCPHCDTALTVPGGLPVAGAICPCCGARIPCHDEAASSVADVPVVASELDAAAPPDAAWVHSAASYLRWLHPFAIVGALGGGMVAALTAVAIIHYADGDWRAYPALALPFLVVVVGFLGFRLAQNGRQVGTRTMGWMIVVFFACMGVAVTIGIVVLAGSALVKATL